MQLRNPRAEIFVPDGKPLEEALGRTTHLAVAAHPDDTEIMAYDGIVRCFGKEEQWFTSVVVTDGAGSPRAGLYANYTNEQMVAIRRREAKKAAVVGEYAATVLLQYTSAQTKDPNERAVIADLKSILLATRPRIVYTHNPADKHPTHVAVTLRLITALREVAGEWQPEAVYGCEVWRDLDWMVDEEKVAFDVSAHENVAMALVGVFDSQIVGGKRYDLATLGRRRANATYWESHGVDVAEAMIFAMDLTPLVQEPYLDVGAYVMERIRRFAEDVDTRLKQLSSAPISTYADGSPQRSPAGETLSRRS